MLTIEGKVNQMNGTYLRCFLFGMFFICAVSAHAGDKLFHVPTGAQVSASQPYQNGGRQRKLIGNRSAILSAFSSAVKQSGAIIKIAPFEDINIFIYNVRKGPTSGVIFSFKGDVGLTGTFTMNYSDMSRRVLIDILTDDQINYTLVSDDGMNFNSYEENMEEIFNKPDNDHSENIEKVAPNSKLSVIAHRDGLGLADQAIR